MSSKNDSLKKKILIQYIQNNIINSFWKDKIPYINDIGVHLSFKQVNFDDDDMVNLISLYNKNITSLAMNLNDIFIYEKLDFPYKKYYMKSLKFYFDNLLQFKQIYNNKPYKILGLTSYSDLFPTTFKNKGYLNLISTNKDYENIDILTDFFTEDVRMKALRKDQRISPFEWFKNKNNKFKVISSILNENKNLNPYELREQIYLNVKECSTFKCSIVKTIYKFFNAKHVLDFSAGWGDRLIGAIGANVLSYTAFDPNTDLVKGHSDIISTFVSQDKQKNFNIQYIPFEKAELKQNFDLVFTSPPYFDFEIYTELKGQSILNHPTYIDWLVDFLFLSLKKSWNHLDRNGYLAIHIADTKNMKVCEVMNLFILCFLPLSEYQGVISSISEKNIARPIWVWKKVQKNYNFQLKNIGFQVFNKHYPAVINKIKISLYK
jgi:16S rRNA G966 N2-methylase RsmD